MTHIIPTPDAKGWLRFPEGFALFPSHSLPGFWHVKRADGSVMTGEGPHNKRSFPTIEAALEAVEAEQKTAA